MRLRARMRSTTFKAISWFVSSDLPDQASQLLRARTADRDARPVVELRLDVAARISLECAHVFEVHDVCAMNLGKPPGIEARDEAAERQMKQMATAAGMSNHVVPVCLEPGHPIDWQQHGRVADSHEQSRDRSAAKCAAQSFDGIDG